MALFATAAAMKKTPFPAIRTVNGTFDLQSGFVSAAKLSNGVPVAQYCLGRKLGHGAYGTVYQTILTTTTENGHCVKSENTTSTLNITGPQHNSYHKTSVVESDVALKVLSPPVSMRMHSAQRVQYAAIIRPGAGPVSRHCMEQRKIGRVELREKVWWLQSQATILAAFSDDQNIMRELTLGECMYVFGTEVDLDTATVVNGIIARNKGSCSLELQRHPEVPTNYCAFLKRRSKVLREAQMMKACAQGCPYTMKLKDVLESVRGCRSEIALVLELAKGGDLFDFVADRQTPMKCSEARKYFGQIIQAVCAAKEIGVSHRDIKLDNLIFRDAEQSHVLLADWGLATQLDAFGMLSSRNGTPGYWAPEVWENRKNDYSAFLADSWALGIALYTMLKGHPPFIEHPWKCRRLKLYKKWQEDNDCYTDGPDWLIPRDWDADTRAFVCSLLCIDCSKRLTIKKLSTHSWLRLPQQLDITELVCATNMSGGESKRGSMVPPVASVSTEEDEEFFGDPNPNPNTKPRASINPADDQTVPHSPNPATDFNKDSFSSCGSGTGSDTSCFSPDASCLSSAPPSRDCNYAATAQAANSEEITVETLMAQLNAVDLTCADYTCGNLYRAKQSAITTDVVYRELPPQCRANLFLESSSLFVDDTNWKEPIMRSMPQDICPPVLKQHPMPVTLSRWFTRSTMGSDECSTLDNLHQQA